MPEDQHPPLHQIIRALQDLDATQIARVQAVRDEYSAYANEQRRKREFADRVIFKRETHVDVLKETIEGLVETIDRARTKLKKDLNDCVMSEPEDILRALGKKQASRDIAWKAWTETQKRFHAELDKATDMGQETDAEKLQDRVQELEQVVARMGLMANNAITGGDEAATALVIISDMAAAARMPVPECASCGDTPDHSEAACQGVHPGWEAARELEEQVEALQNVIESLRSAAREDQREGEMMPPQYVLDMLPAENIPDEAYPCATCGAVEADHVGYVLGHNYTSGREDQS